MTIRVCLELNQFDRLPSLFSALRPSSPRQEHQIEVLKLLQVFVKGFASEHDSNNFLSLIPVMLSEELSWFVRFFPQLLLCQEVRLQTSD